MILDELKIKSELKRSTILGIVKRFGILGIADLALWFLLISASRRFYRLKSSAYGLQEALFHPRDIDRWNRYTRIMNSIRKARIRCNSILEVGSGVTGITQILSQMPYEITFVDIKKVFVNITHAHVVIASGYALPFKNSSFDLVISADTIEHIPLLSRYNFVSELKRVCKRLFIVTCPLQSKNGFFLGQRYDIYFQRIHERLLGFEAKKTSEHVILGHPTLEQMLQWLPNSTVLGYMNCLVWIKQMTLSRIPIIGFLTGILYLLLWKKKDNDPPYWGAVVTWKKN